MDIRTVNVERFNQAFEAMLKNADFKQSDTYNCLVGSYEKFVLGTTPIKDCFFARTGDSFDSHFNVSRECFVEWYQPLNEENDSWPETIDLTDALACTENVKRIVEKHHGPQQWQAIEKETPGPTLEQFLSTLGVSRPVHNAE